MAAMVTVDVPPLQSIGLVTVALVNDKAVGWVIVIVPVNGVQLFPSVMLYERLLPAKTPVKIPVVLV